jgi:hypothetical protein
MIPIRLSKPIEIRGEQVTQLHLDLDALTGFHLIEAEKQARMRGDTSAKPLLSMEGLSILAAKLAGTKPEDIMGLPAPDFLLVTETVSNFLFAWVLPSLTVPESSGN